MRIENDKQCLQKKKDILCLSEERWKGENNLEIERTEDSEREYRIQKCI